ncbi:unnamed protein product [Auanema sp. JU1783]|nr:unnamed protein product [Auanema sp. JU1783]
MRTTVSYTSSVHYVISESASDYYHTMPGNKLQDNIRNAIILFGICLPGFLMNLFSSIVLLRHKSFRNPFGKLVAFHTISNASLVFLLLGWSAPLTILSSFTHFDSEVFMQINHRIGQLSIFFQECSYHICVFISFNRFLAIGKPMLSRRVFNDRTTNYIIIFTLIICSIFGFVYFLPGCNFFYDTSTDIWSFDQTSCGSILASVDLYYNVGIFTINCIIDMLTLLLLRGANERIYKTMRNTTREEAQRRQRREILFFSQALINTLVYCFMLFSFHVLSTHFEDLFHVYLFTTVAWASAHSSGGLIVILFNSEIRRSIMCWRKTAKKSNMITVCSTLPQISTIN